MHTRTPISCTLLAVLATAAASAADGGTWDYYVRVQASIGLLGLSGDAMYADQGVPGTTFDVKDVGLDERRATPALELGLGMPLLDFQGFIGWQSWSADGSATLAQDISYGGETFTASTPVTSEATLTDLYAEFNWSPIALNVAGFSLGLAAHQLTVTSTIAAAGQSAKLDESAILPTLAVRAYVAPLDMLEAEAMVHALAVPLGDAKGSFVHAQVQVSYYPTTYIGTFIGYRHTGIDIEIKKSGRRAEADVAISGPFIGLAAQF